MSDDDYMTMTFGDDDYASPSASSNKRKPVETSLQRRIRREREGRERGRVLSKAEQARAAEQAREAALSRSLFEAPAPASASAAAASSIPAAPAPKPVNKGFAMMAKMGFVAGQALGKKRTAADGGHKNEHKDDKDDKDKDRPLTEPIRIQVKRDRAGIGAAEEQKERQKERQEKEEKEAARDMAAAVETDPYAYRDRIRLEREEGRLERQMHAAQVVAERLASGDDDDDGDHAEKDDRALSDVNVLWRGMVKQRREKERERALRIQSQRLLDHRLRDLVSGGGGGGGGDSAATRTADSDDEAEGVRASYLKSGLSSVVVDAGDDDDDGDGDGDADTEDGELAEFDALPAQERLQQVVDWMRLNRRYCFWCKHTYASDALDGCPGPTEADHD